MMQFLLTEHPPHSTPTLVRTRPSGGIGNGGSFSFEKGRMDHFARQNSSPMRGCGAAVMRFPEFESPIPAS